MRMIFQPWPKGELAFFLPSAQRGRGRRYDSQDNKQTFLPLILQVSGMRKVHVLGTDQ